jgi:hypothetical protein
MGAAECGTLLGSSRMGNSRLGIERGSDHGVPTLTCTGWAESETLDTLRTALDGVHADALGGSVPTVIADLRGLEFVSSTCLKAFVTWLQRVKELDDKKRYRIVFRSNPTHSWQHRSLGALAAFAGNVVSIETVTS